MKVIPEITELAKEHHLSLVLANQCIKAVRAQQPDEIATLCSNIAKTFSHEWADHFATEERLVFMYLIQHDTPLKEHALQLTEEHVTLLNMAKKLKMDHSLLGEFGLLLKNHTRLEDRQVFPFLAEYLTTEQLKEVEWHYLSTQQ